MDVSKDKSNHKVPPKPRLEAYVYSYDLTKISLEGTYKALIADLHAGRPHAPENRS